MTFFTCEKSLQKITFLVKCRKCLFIINGFIWFYFYFNREFTLERNLMHAINAKKVSLYDLKIFLSLVIYDHFFNIFPLFVIECITKAQLRSHKLHRHIGVTYEKNNLCPTCGKCFVKPHDLNVHIRAHLGMSKKIRC